MAELMDLQNMDESILAAELGRREKIRKDEYCAQLAARYKQARANEKTKLTELAAEYKLTFSEFSDLMEAAQEITDYHDYY